MYKHILSILCICLAMTGCSKSFLDEEPNALDPDNAALSNVMGFESAIAALYEAARDQFKDSTGPFNMHIGTDIAIIGDPALPDNRNVITSITPEANMVLYYWHWAYLKMLPRANTIIAGAENNDVDWESEAQKNSYIAEAKFFRAYALEIIVNIFGKVPVVLEPVRSPKTDFYREERKKTFEIIRDDLLFATKWLPDTPPAEGRITKGVAWHLLAETYICLEEYDLAIDAASQVIDGGQYELMKERFGKYTDQPGDVFSDLFLEGNQSPASGNKEILLCYQIEYDTPGGGGQTNGNIWLRAFGPRYFDLKDPDGNAGMQVCDSLGRSPGWIRMTNYANYDIWAGDNWDDMRNSKYNIRRDWYFNAGPHAGEKVPEWSESYQYDTLYVLYPQWRKVEGESKSGVSTGRTWKDYPIIRLAETYLLRAEAYMKKGGADNLQKAADDINELRNRAHAKPITADEVTMDYILDERARELMIEELRRKTLSRTGTLYERTKKYTILETTRETIQPYHQWFPIPQQAIDANTDRPLGQNFGYPGATESEIVPLL